LLEMTPDLMRAANVADPNAFLEKAGIQLPRAHDDRPVRLLLVAAGRTTVSEAMKVAVQLEE